MSSAKNKERANHNRRGSSRKKTGCATCKARHTRCDEKSPVCSNCERLGLQCHPSEFINQSTWSSILSIDPKPAGDRETESVSTSKLLPLSSSFTTQISSKESSTSKPSSSSTPLNGESTESSSQLSSAILVDLNDETVFLLNTFRTGLATWMDVFDFENTYEREVTKRALRSDLLILCICAFTAKNLSLLASGEVWDPIASRYYGESLNHMIAALNYEEPDSDALTAALLLSSYEVIAASSISHQSHFKGAMNLILTRGISARSVGLDRANFIVFIRHEIWIALSNQRSLQFDLQRWNIMKPGVGAGEDHIAHYLMFLIGHVVNVIYKNDGLASDRIKLKDQLDEWYSITTPEFRGIPHGEISNHGPPKIFFPVPATAAAMLWFHAAQILLSIEGGSPYRIPETSIQEHSKSIIRIASSTLPNCVRCFAIDPIYIVGKHSREIPEKMRCYALLDAIEREVGYRTRDKRRSLEQMMDSTDFSDRRGLL